MNEREVSLDEFGSGEAEQINGHERDQHLPEIDELPKDWSLVTVEEVADDLVGGGTPTKSNDDYWGGDIPWASVKDLNGIELSETEDYITQAGVEDSTTNVAPTDSIIISTRMTVGEPFLNKVAMAINQDMKAIIPDTEKVNPLFLVYSLWDKDSYLKSLGRGTTVDGITTRDLLLTHLGLPSLEEQHKIASVLYTVDEAIQTTERIIDQRKIIRKGLMQDLFSGLTSQPTKDIRLSAVDVEIPEHWEVRTIEEVSTQITDGAHLTPDRSEDGYLLLSARNVRDGYLDLSEVDYVPEEEYQRLINKCNPEPGDILISCSGTVGRVCEVPEGLEFALVRSAALVKFDNTILPSYAEKVLQWNGVQKQIIGYQTQSAQPNLFQGQIASLEIPIPPKEEQNEIAQRLDNISDTIEANQECKSRLKRLKQALMQDLLSGEVRTNDKDIEIIEDVLQHG